MKNLMNYQSEVDKSKLTASAIFEKVTFRAQAVFRICSDEGLTLETSAFQNSLRRLIYLIHFTLITKCIY